MYNFLYSIFIYILESITITILIKSLHNIEFKTISKRIVPCLLGNAVAATVLNSICPTPANLILGILVSLFIYACLFQISFIDTFYAFAISYSFVIFFQLIVISLLPPSVMSVSSIYVEVGGNLLMIIFFGLLCKKVALHPLLKNNSWGMLIKLIFSCNYIIQYANIIHSKLSPEDSIRLMPMYILFAVILLIICLSIIRQYEAYRKLQIQLDDYKTYQPVLAELIDHVRERQHEFDNQLLSIRSLPLVHKDYESLSYAINNNTAAIMHNLQTTTLIRINLKLVAAFLFSKTRQAANENKHLNITIKNNIIQTAMPEYELIEVLGILIDNAIEAIDYDESVSIYLDSTNNQVTITVINKGPELSNELRSQFFQKGYSTKSITSAKSKRGFGLSRLKRLVDTYNGTIMLNNSESAGETLIRFDVVI